MVIQRDAPTPGNESSTEIAYRIVKAAIIDGSLAPGTSASEQQVATRLNMSRTPVHQAFVRLEQEGWLKVNSRRGVQITPIIAKEMEDIYETLMALEGAAARRLARRPADSPDDIDAELLRASASCEVALAQGDLIAWALADNELHTLLVAACGNPRLIQLARAVMEQAHRARLLTVRLRPLPSSSNEDHKEIVKAIIDRQPQAARDALEAHRQHAIDTLIPIIQAMRPSGLSFLP
jgi:DNA-binding GntR family transcriptional regulator